MTFTPPAPAAPAATYVCRYCRLRTDPTASSCPNCGAPVDVQAVVSDSGWVEQPPVRDMAKIQFGRSFCQVEGTLVPAVDFSIAQEEGVVFSHHTLLWSGPGTHLEPWSQGGAFNRLLAGMPLVLMRASGPGHVALSEDHPGEVVALPIPPGRGFNVREHAFLAITDATQFSWQPSEVWVRVQSGSDRNDTELEYPLGRFIDLFSAGDAPGLLLLHCPGNLFVRDLAPGQGILVQPGAWVYADTSVTMSLHLEYPASRGMGWSGYQYRTVWLRLQGPGRVAVRSIFEKPERYANVIASSPMTSWRW
jgi:uncharacterized protein (AIM24 family)